FMVSVCDRHSCPTRRSSDLGHDGHTSTLFALVDMLSEKQASGSLNGAVSFIFQFAEEIQPGGAISMVEDNVLDGVDKVYGQHYGASIRRTPSRQNPVRSFRARIILSLPSTVKAGMRHTLTMQSTLC